MGVTVGLANVRILPDTRGFAKKLEAELKRLNDVRVEVGVDFDAEGLAQKAKAAADAASKSTKVKPDVDVDAQEIVQKAKSASESASKSTKVKPDVDVDAEGLTRRARAAAKMASLGSKVEFAADFDANGLVRKAREAARDAGKRAIHFAAEIDPSVLVAKARAARMVAQRAMGNLKVGLELNNGAALRLAVQAASVQMNMFGASIMTTALTALPELIGKAGLAAVAVGGLAGPLVAVSAQALAAAGSMAALGAAMAPSAIMAAGMAVGVLKSAFSGMGDAINAESVEDFNKAIEGMPPAAQEAAGALRDLKTQMSELGDSVSQSFWENFTNIGDLSAVLAPLQASMTALAADMGKATSGLVAFVSQGVGLEAMTTMLDHAQTAGSNLSYAFAAVAKGLVAVGAAVGPVLGDMTAKIEQMATAWSERMVAGFQDGSLQQYFSDAAVKVQEFWGVLQQVGSIVGAVFSAMNAAGAPFLGTIGQAITATEQWVTSAQGMEALTSFFTNMTTAVGVLLPVIGQLATIIGTTVAPAIADFVTAIGPGLQSAMDGLGRGLQVIAPFASVVGSALGSVLSAVAPLLPVLAPLIPLLGAMAKAFQMVQGVLPVVSALLGGLSWPIVAIGAAVGMLVAAFAQTPGAMEQLQGAFGRLMEALQPILDVLMQVVQQIIAALMPAFQALIPIVIQIVDFVAQLLPIIAPILQIIGQLAATIISALVPIIMALLPLISTVIGVLSQIVAALMPIVMAILNVVAAFARLLGTILTFVAQALAAIVGFVAGVIGGFLRMVGTVVSAIVNFVGQVLTWIGNLVSRGVQKFQEMWDRTSSAFSNGISRAVSFVSQMPGRVMSALGNVGSLLVNSGRALIQGFINGIKSMVGAVADAARGVVKKARDFFPFSPAKKGPFSGRGYTSFSGKALATDFAGGIKSATPLAARATEGLMNAASGNLRGYRAGVDLASAGSGAGGAGVDTSVHIGQLVAADMSAPLEQVKTMQLRAQIKAGIA